MDKKVIFAVAGSGKTTLLINNLDVHKRFLLITYTYNNLAGLRQKILQKFGFFPPNIKLFTYFTFLHWFCYKPFFLLELRTKGLNFQNPPDWTRKLYRTDIRFYVDNGRRLYHNRVAKLLGVKDALGLLRQRLEKYFDVLYVDEVQDFAGHDFNLLLTICDSKLDVVLVGDFYQHTFDTSRDGLTNASLHDDYAKFKERFKVAGLTIDTTSLSKSFRCSQTVCEFIRTQLGIEIYSHGTTSTDVVLIKCQEDADRLHGCERTIKLFYKEHHKYRCHSDNWGISKGADHYVDVCVVLNGKTLKAFSEKGLASINPQTRNKLYVACSRARGNLYLLPYLMIKKFKSDGN